MAELVLPEEIKKTKFQALDGLRGISIILVILSHSLENFQLGGLASGIYFGKIGVYIFFVISGFLITTLLLKEKMKYGEVSLKGFYIRRSFRILPLVYLYLAVLFLLNIIYNLKITGFSFLMSSLFLKNLQLKNLDWYTNHLWSLAVEEQFYLIIPFLFTRLSLSNFKKIIQIAIVLLPIMTFAYYGKLDIDFFHTPRFIHLGLGIIVNIFGGGTVFILIGSLFSIMFLSQNKYLLWIYEKGANFSSIILFLIAIIINLPITPWYVPYISDAIFGLLIATVIILNLKEQSFFSQILNLKFLSTLGILSYSIYIWQQLFTSMQPWSPTGQNIIPLLLNLAVLFVVATLSYYFYENKFLKFKDRFKRV
jgi:peptidoglycan/LPS O-acetylase OafA/YrhL